MSDFYRLALKQAKKKPERSLDQIHDNLNPKILDMIKSCLQIDISKRVTVDELLCNPMFDLMRSIMMPLDATAPSKIEVRIDEMEMVGGLPLEYTVS